MRRFCTRQGAAHLSPHFESGHAGEYAGGACAGRTHGCNIVEVDIRTTLDGEVVLYHDGYLERLTDGMGDVEFDDIR